MARILTGILGVLVVIGGIYCLVTPWAAFLSLAWILGVVMFADGISNVVVWSKVRREIEGSGWLLAGAILSIVCGLIVVFDFFGQFAVATVMVYITAFWLVLNGILRIVSAFKLRKLQSALSRGAAKSMGLSWGWMLAFGILLTVFGVLSLSSPVFLASFIGTVLGISVIVCGVNLVGFALAARR